MYFSDDELNIFQEGVFGIWECVYHIQLLESCLLEQIVVHLPMKPHACGKLSAIFCLLTEKIGQDYLLGYSYVTSQL